LIKQHFEIQPALVHLFKILLCCWKFLLF